MTNMNSKRTISCCARKLKCDKRRVFLTPRNWGGGKAYALTQFTQLSMVMEYDSYD